MTATAARDRLTVWDIDVLPRVSREVVNRCLISAVSLLEATKDDHVGRFWIHRTSVLIAQENLITAGTNSLPGHRAQVQIVKLVSVKIISGGSEMTTCARNVTAKDIHVIFVNARGVVGDTTWNILSVTCRLDLSPLIIALDRVSSWRTKLFGVNLTHAL